MDYLAFVGGIILWFIALEHLIVRTKTTAAYMFSLLYGTTGCLAFYFWSLETGAIQHAPILIDIDLAITFIIGPALFLYYRFTIRSDQHFEPQFILHMLPALFVLGFVLVRNLIAPLVDPPLEMLPSYHTGGVRTYVSIISDLWVFGYMTIIAVRAVNFHKEPAVKEVQGHRAFSAFFVLFALNSAGLVSAHLFKNDLFISISFTVFVLLALAHSLFTTRYPSFAVDIQSANRKRRATCVRMNKEEIELGIERLRKLMEDRKIYRDPILTLAKLSTMVGMPVYQLSYILNSRIHSNFSTYVNAYRIREARELLLNKPDMSILDIVYATGFNSKSTFNTCFHVSTGKTPSEYRHSTITPTIRPDL